LSEAIRLNGHTFHIANPQSEVVKLAGEFEPDRLINGFEQYLLETKIETVDKNGVIREKRASIDTYVLMAAVYSFPTPKDEADREMVAMFYDQAIKFHNKEFKELHFACEHTDESHFHIHVFTFTTNAKYIHPGYIAKNKANNKDKQAYKNAMRDFQTRFNQQVACHFGMERHGPLRPRVPSKYYKQKKEALEQLEEFKAELDKKRKKMEQEFKEKALELYRQLQKLKQQHLEDERFYISSMEENERGMAEMREQFNYLKTQLQVGSELFAKFQEFLAVELDPYASDSIFLDDTDDDFDMR
jgi:hypothetical protein